MDDAGVRELVWNPPNVLGIGLIIARAVVVGASLAMQQRTQERRHIGDGQAVPLSVSCETRRIEEALQSVQSSQCCSPVRP